MRIYSFYSHRVKEHILIRKNSKNDPFSSKKIIFATHAIYCLMIVAGCVETSVCTKKTCGCSEGKVRKTKLLVKLPDYAPTPDGMAIDKAGNLVVACPNYGSYAKDATKPSKPGCFIKITKDGKVSKWFDCPAKTAM